MSALPALDPTTPVRPLAESRPPCRTWQPVGRSGAARAPGVAEPGSAAVGAAPGPPEGAPPGTRVGLVRAPWTARPDPDLPPAAAWSASLAVAVVEALLARRPVAQLNRWLSEEVLASVTLQQRRRRPGSGAATPPALVLIRVQHPASRVAEVSAFLRVGRQPLVLALRLEGLGHRWLCTALELGGRTSPGTADAEVTGAGGGPGSGGRRPGAAPGTAG